MNVSTDLLIKDGISAAKSGDKSFAKHRFAQAIQNDPRNARAWYLLSKVVEDKDQKVYCLEKVLQILPNNANAKKRLALLRGESISYSRGVSLSELLTKMIDRISFKLSTQRIYLPAIIAAALVLVCVSVFAISFFSDYLIAKSAGLSSIERTPQSEYASLPPHNINDISSISTTHGDSLWLFIIVPKGFFEVDANATIDYYQNEFSNAWALNITFMCDDQFVGRNYIDHDDVSYESYYSHVLYEYLYTADPPTKILYTPNDPYIDIQGSACR